MTIPTCMSGEGYTSVVLVPIGVCTTTCIWAMSDQVIAFRRKCSGMMLPSVSLGLCVYALVSECL